MNKSILLTLALLGITAQTHAAFKMNFGVFRPEQVTRANKELATVFGTPATWSEAVGSATNATTAFVGKHPYLFAALLLAGGVYGLYRYLKLPSDVQMIHPADDARI